MLGIVYSRAIVQWIEEMEGQKEREENYES